MIAFYFMQYTTTSSWDYLQYSQYQLNAKREREGTEYNQAESQNNKYRYAIKMQLITIN